MTVALYSNAPRVKRVSITIPASGSPAETLQNLVIAGLEAKETGLGVEEASHVMGGRVNIVATGYVAGDAPNDLPLTITAGNIYEEPSNGFLSQTYVKSTGVSIAAVVSVYLTAK